MPFSTLFFRRAAVFLLLGFSVAGCTTTELESVAPTTTVSTSGRYSAVVVDAQNGRMLYQANAEAERYPASLTKMMTLYLLFEAIDAGKMSKSTEIPISDHARRQPPSKIGFKSGQTIDADTAIRALATKSANDVAVAVGEYIAGSEEAFAATMTAKARVLGMRNTIFRNASGLPDDGQHSTARDMALLGMALRQRFPHHYHYFSEKDFVFRGRTIRGHNDLIGRVPGVDGIKTGYVRASGYNIVTSVNNGSRRLIVVVMGGDSARSRNDHVEELIRRYLPAAAGS